MTGERFGPYQLVSSLGRGGMGEVWRAVDIRKGREVAVKVLGSWLGHDADLVRRFRHEAALTARLNSPYIVPIHNYGEVDGRLFLEMPIVDGRDLGSVLALAGPLPPARAVGIVSQVARALDVAHQEGLVHRDVKPSNILLTGEDNSEGGHCYLIDFGIARLLDGTRYSLSGAVIGTPAYMAPERFDGDGDHRADVYALTCVLYEALTGHKPFDGENLWALMNHHVSTSPPRPSESAAVSAALDDVVARGMAKDVTDRFDRAADLATAARAALATPNPKAEPATVAETVTVPTGRLLAPQAHTPWRIPGGTRQPVASDERVVVFVEAPNTLVCVDVATGDTHWRRSLPSIVQAPPVLAYDTIYTGCDDHAVHALALDGRTVWTFPTGDRVDGGIAAADRNAVYVVSHDHHLYKIGVSGDLRWRAPIDEVLPTEAGVARWFDATPAVADGRVVVCGSDGAVRAFDADRGDPLWMRQGLHAGAAHAGSTNERIPAPIAFGPVAALVGSGRRETGAVLHVLDAATGEMLWNRPAGKPARDVRGRRIVAAGDLLVLREQYGASAMGPADGSVRWRIDLPEVVDIDARGQAVLCLHRRGVTAVDATDGRMLWARPLADIDQVGPRISAGPRTLVVSDPHRLVVLDPDTGEPRT